MELSIGRKKLMLTDRANAICLLNILREYSDENHIIPMREIISKMNSRYDLKLDRRTIYSAVSLLLDLNYDISTYDENGKGYYLREREFTLPEARLIMDSIYSFSGISPTHTVDLVKKVQSILSVHERKKYRNLTVIKTGNKTDNQQVFLNIELLDEAIDKKVKVEFTYLEYGFDKRLKPRREQKYIVNPYGLVCANEHYYLICNYDEYDGISHYRIDKIGGIEFSDSKVKPAPKNFDPAIYTQKSIYMFTGKQERVSIKCDNGILSDVLDKFGHDINIIKIDDDTFTTSFTAMPQGILFWALQYLPYCEVLSPKWLRDQIIEHIGMNRYK